MKTVLITGATSGIGKACAEIFAENNCKLIIAGRRQERLSELKNVLFKKHKTEIIDLCFDVRNKEGVINSLKPIINSNIKIDILINNAGLAAGFGPIDEGETENWERMIDTNIKGLLYVSKMIIPVMKKQHSGHIINIGSVAGKETYINGNVYCATKHAVDALTKAMRIDLLPHNIKVTGICPGAAETEFSLVRYNGDAEKAKNIYKGFTPLSAKDIAEVIWFTASLPEHVCINDLVITPTAQANTVHTYKKP
jgi:3-hydroxy acid dehydrogenase / malonic semialdehyde reductase